MKKVLLLLSAPLILAACNSGASSDKTEAPQVKHSEYKSEEARRHEREEVSAKKESEESHAAEAPAPEQKKKGWSNTAKGAVIGAGAGAVAGAVIDKNNRGAGAVIGGLAGAAVGAGTGAVIDHKKKQKEQQAASGQ